MATRTEPTPQAPVVKPGYQSANAPGTINVDVVTLMEYKRGISWLQGELHSLQSLARAMTKRDIKVVIGPTACTDGDTIYLPPPRIAEGAKPPTRKYMAYLHHEVAHAVDSQVFDPPESRKIEDTIKMIGERKYGAGTGWIWNALEDGRVENRLYRYAPGARKHIAGDVEESTDQVIRSIERNVEMSAEQQDDMRLILATYFRSAGYEEWVAKFGPRVAETVEDDELKQIFRKVHKIEKSRDVLHDLTAPFMKRAKELGFFADFDSRAGRDKNGQPQVVDWNDLTEAEKQDLRDAAEQDLLESDPSKAGKIVKNAPPELFKNQKPQPSQPGQSQQPEEQESQPGKDRQDGAGQDEAGNGEESSDSEGSGTDERGEASQAQDGQGEEGLGEQGSSRDGSGEDSQGSEGQGSAEQGSVRPGEDGQAPAQQGMDSGQPGSQAGPSKKAIAEPINLTDDGTGSEDTTSDIEAGPVNITVVENRAKEIHEEREQQRVSRLEKFGRAFEEIEEKVRPPHQHMKTKAEVKVLEAHDRTAQEIKAAQELEVGHIWGAPKSDFAFEKQKIEAYGRSSTAEVDQYIDVIAGNVSRLRAVFKQNEKGSFTGQYEMGTHLNQRALAPFVMKEHLKPFDRRVKPKKLSYAVTLLIDQSGSMSGEKIRMARVALLMQAEMLNRLQIKFEILGFTTRGAGATILHKEYKSFDEPWTTKERNRVLQIESFDYNLDGFAVAWAWDRLRVRNEKVKILMTYSDGMPAPDSDGQVKIIKYVLNRMRAVGAIAIGIGIQSTAVDRLYPITVHCDDVRTLPRKVIETLATELRKKR